MGLKAGLDPTFWKYVQMWKQYFKGLNSKKTKFPIFKGFGSVFNVSQFSFYILYLVLVILKIMTLSLSFWCLRIDKKNPNFAITFSNLFTPLSCSWFWHNSLWKKIRGGGIFCKGWIKISALQKVSRNNSIIPLPLENKISRSWDHHTRGYSDDVR